MSLKEAKLQVAIAKENVIKTEVVCSWCSDYPCIYIVITIIICTCYLQLKCLEENVHNEKRKVVHSTVSPFPMEEISSYKDRSEFEEVHKGMVKFEGIIPKGMLWLII